MWLHTMLLQWKKILIVDNPTIMMTKLVPMIKLRYYLDLIGVDSIWRPLEVWEWSNMDDFHGPNKNRCTCRSSSKIWDDLTVP